MKFILDQQV